jgi:hypothetical protein
MASSDCFGDCNDIDDLFLTQDFMAVPVMGTLLVLALS